ncbi:unnamed protein product [Brassica rapa subsp. trilocularis]
MSQNMIRISQRARDLTTPRVYMYTSPYVCLYLCRSPAPQRKGC